jgi:hypothetical protein
MATGKQRIDPRVPYDPRSMRRAALLTAVFLTVTLAPATSARAQVFITPSQGQILDPGPYVAGDCYVDDGKLQSDYTYWDVAGVIPAFKHGGNGGVELAPKAEALPRLGKGPDTAPFQNNWVLDPKLIATPTRPSGCGVRSFDPLNARALEQAGPYVFTQYTQTVDFILRTADDPGRPPSACAGNDPDFPSPVDVNPPPLPEGSSSRYDVDTFCNTTKTTGFYVTARAQCPVSQDMTQWPVAPYINQYDAGERLLLPVGQGKRGGNACGPSSLLMAMLGWSGANDLPTLKDAFDHTMQLSSSQVTANAENSFVGSPKAVAYAKSLGWLSAHTVGLGTSVEEIELHVLEALSKGPVVISTAFGGARWGKTGGGHMIAIVAADGRGSFIVEDPAGNYFSTPKNGYFNPSTGSGGHYGPGSCGHKAVYPHFWLEAYVTGRWLLTLGPRATPQPGGRVTRAAAAAASPRYGSAIAISDASPGSADDPQSFYLQDASGRRAGWIDGAPVAEIPDAAVDKDVPGYTNPALGDDELGPLPGDPPPTPRSIVLPGGTSGLTLHVTAATGGRFALRAQGWQDGVSGDEKTITGSGTGGDGVVALPALTVNVSAARAGLSAGKAKVKRRVVTIPLACAAAAKSSCHYKAVLSAKQGKRTVVIAKRSGTLRSGKKLKVSLKPTAAGRRFLAKHRRVSATLAVNDLPRQRLRI